MASGFFGVSMLSTSCDASAIGMSAVDGGAITESTVVLFRSVLFRSSGGFGGASEAGMTGSGTETTDDSVAGGVGGTCSFTVGFTSISGVGAEGGSGAGSTGGRPASTGADAASVGTAGLPGSLVIPAASLITFCAASRMSSGIRKINEYNTYE